MNEMEDYIGTECICVHCGELKLAVCLDDDNLPTCFECAKDIWPPGEVLKDCMSISNL